MDAYGWMLLTMSLLSAFAFALSWAAWLHASEAKQSIDDLRYKLRRELGSDGL